MLKRLLILTLVFAFTAQGIARAEEPAGAGVTTVPDRRALLAHIEAMSAGDRIAVITEDGVVTGEFVDRDTDDLVIDQPLLEGGADRITIPLKEIQGVSYQPLSASNQSRTITVVAVVAGVVVGTLLLIARAFSHWG